MMCLLSDGAAGSCCIVKIWHMLQQNVCESGAVTPRTVKQYVLPVSAAAVGSRAHSRMLQSLETIQQPV